MSLPRYSRSTGCPCGHGFRDPCILTVPAPAAVKPPCNQRCRGMGYEQIRHYSAKYGCCPCSAVAGVR
jgi:hypothetical protein